MNVGDDKSPASDDALTRFVFEGAAVRGVRVRLAETTRGVLATHPYPPPLARVIAELCGAATLLASTLKFDGSLIVQLQGSGPVRLLVVECDQQLGVRATAQWDADRVAALAADAMLADLAGGAGRARLVITLDPKGSGTIYQGIVELETASVSRMIEHYLAASEQLPSVLALAVDGDTVCGMLLQRMPGSGADDEKTWERATAQLASASPAALAAAATDNAALLQLFPGSDLRVFRARSPRFACSCSPARVEYALRLAGRAEVEAALTERGDVEVICEFCNRRYVYGPDAARALFPAAANGPATQH